MINLQLPSDGSVIIIDDRIGEVLPLIKLLSKKGIASTYFSGRDEELPANPVQKVRLAFVDIQLFPLADSHTYAQNIMRLLDRIIPDNNGPYMLIIWSVLEDVHAETLEAQVTSDAFVKRPVCVLRLHKANFFERRVDESLKEELLSEIDRTLGMRFHDEDIGVIKNVIDSKIISETVNVAKYDALENISSLLLKKLKDHEAIRLFTIWENLIHKASGETVKSFSALHKEDDYWQNNLKCSLYRMAHAQLGKTVDLVTEDELIRNALKTFNHTFIDTVESKVSEITDFSGTIRIDRKNIRLSAKLNGNEYTIKWNAKSGEYSLFIDGVGMPAGKPTMTTKVDKLSGWGGTPEKKAQIEKLIKVYASIEPEINTRLLIDFTVSKSIQPGNVYKKNGIHWNRKKKILKAYLRETSSVLNNNKEIKKFIFVELEVSPLCDRVQEKWLKSRLLPGVLIPKEFINNYDEKRESLYKQIPVLKIESQYYKPVFDFRLLKSVDIETRRSKLDQPLFRVKRELFADILTRFSSHASRIGVTCIE